MLNLLAIFSLANDNDSPIGLTGLKKTGEIIQTESEPAEYDECRWLKFVKD